MIDDWLAKKNGRSASASFGDPAQRRTSAAVGQGLLSAVNKTRDRVLGDAIREADAFLLRARGLLRADGLPEGEGLWICPCRSIHSFGMRFEFDALFLDAKWRVVGVYSRFHRNRISRIFWSARGVLELPAGRIESTGTEVGDEIEFHG